MTGLRHHESKFPDSCNLENVHEWIYVIFLDQVQILYLDLLLFKEISNDLDQLLVALLFLPQALFYLKVYSTLAHLLYLILFCFPKFF